MIWLALFAGLCLGAAFTLTMVKSFILDTIVKYNGAIIHVPIDKKDYYVAIMDELYEDKESE